MKILVVDDIGYTRHYHSRLLERNGFSVLTAAHGLDALDILQQEPGIDAVLTDLMMPDVDGIELVQRAEKQSQQDGVPAPRFILMTALQPNGQSSMDDMRRLHQAQNESFVKIFRKPLDPPALVDLLNSIGQEERLKPRANPSGLPAVSVKERTETEAKQIRDLIAGLLKSGEASTAQGVHDRLQQELNQLARQIQMASM